MDNAHELASRLLDLLRREHAAMADFLIALSDFDRRRLWVVLGYSSLFQFLHRELGMSKGAAHYRKTAAELIQRVPEVVGPLRDGRICITSIIELAKVLTPENRHEVLPRFFNCSKQEAKAVSAELCPAEAAPHRTVVTAMTFTLPERQDSVRAQPHVVHPVELPAASAPTGHLVTPKPSAPRTTAEPLTADLRRLHVTVSKRFMEKLEAARDALSHSHPGGDVEAVLEAGLDLLIERAAKRKGIVSRPRTITPSASPEGEIDSDHIPARVRREVWVRDGGRCQWPVSNGGICGSTQRVEFDHVVPRARGGASTASNLRLCCRFHNDLAARQVFGDTFMDRYTSSVPQLPAAASDAR